MWSDYLLQLNVFRTFEQQKRRCWHEPNPEQFQAVYTEASELNNCLHTLSHVSTTFLINVTVIILIIEQWAELELHYLDSDCAQSGHRCADVFLWRSCVGELREKKSSFRNVGSFFQFGSCFAERSWLLTKTWTSTEGRNLSQQVVRINQWKTSVLKVNLDIKLSKF